MRMNPLNIPKIASALLLPLAIGACSDDGDTPPRPVYEAEIRVTAHGLPHVQAADFGSLGFGIAQAYVRDNFCLVAEQLLSVSGTRSRWFGPDGRTAIANVPLSNRDSDFFFRSYLDDATLAAQFAAEPQEVRDLVRGYVAGYNDWLSRSAATAPASCRGQPWLRSMTEADFLRLMMEVTLFASGAPMARGLVAAQPPAVTSSTTGSAAPLPYAEEAAAVFRAGHEASPAGSNGYALGRDVTANGAGMLLGNPHWPWTGPYRFYALHATVPGRYDALGATFMGSPLPLLGFNADVAWTVMVSPALRQTAYELQLKPGAPTVYIVDGVEREMARRTVSIEVRVAPDAPIVTETRTLYSSDFGPLVVSPVPLPPSVRSLTWTGERAYALRDVNALNLRVLTQALRLGQSRSAAEVRQALAQVHGSSLVATVAVDRGGQALYADIGAMPNLAAARQTLAAQGGCMLGATAPVPSQPTPLAILDGSRSVCQWDTAADTAQPGMVPASAQPALLTSYFAANSNNSYWLPNDRDRIEGFPPLMGGERSERSLRQRLGIQQVTARIAGTDGLAPGGPRGFDSLDRLRDVLFGNRLLAAELSVDSWVALCGTLGTPPQAPLAGGATIDVQQACTVLSQWDRRADLDSRGALLFRELWRSARSTPGLWAVPFDPADPLNTPRELNIASPAVRAQLAQHLGTTVRRLQDLGLDITQPLSAYQAVTRAGRRIPLHGGDEHEGAFNKLSMLDGSALAPLTGAGYTEVQVGSSFVFAATWDQSASGRVRAQGVMASSQSSDPASPHHADQTESLYAQKRSAPLPFHADEVEAARIGPVVRVSGG